MDRNKLAEEYAVANEQATLNVERIKRAFLAGFDACLSQLSGLENESRSAIACRLILANAKIQELEKLNVEYADLKVKSLTEESRMQKSELTRLRDKITELEQQLKELKNEKK